MGYWQTSRNGNSFSSSPEAELLWGDTPADIMDVAIAKIRKVFRDEIGREVSLAELQAGLGFATNPLVHDGELRELPED